MSYCKDFGKDKVIFATKEDHAKPSTVELPDSQPAPGLILPNGEINWNCPCLGGMATGPCGVEFRDAFSCFHYSEADPKGSDCYDTFKEMQDCFSKYPTVYNKSGSDDEDDGGDLDLTQMNDPDSLRDDGMERLTNSRENNETVDILEEKEVALVVETSKK